MSIKKTIVVVIFLSSFVVNAQNIKKPKINLPKKEKTTPDKKVTESPAQVYIDGANNDIKNLEAMLENPKWESSAYENSFTIKLNYLENNIEKIKIKDPDYDVSNIEKKYTYFKNEKTKGVEIAKKIKQEKINKQKEKEEKERAEKFAETHKQINDEGITNSTHQKYINKIVFSTAKIAKQSPVESTFGESFDINSSIHFRAYFKTSTYNYLIKKYSGNYIARDGGLYCKIYIDEELAYNSKLNRKVSGLKLITDEDIKTATTISGALDLNFKDVGSNEFFEALIEKESKLTQGNHNIKFELYPSYISSDNEAGELMASGNFTLNITSNFINPKNYKICMPASKKTDIKLEQKFLAKAKTLWTNEYGMLGEVKKAVIRTPNWVVHKNEYTGKILYRSMDVAVAISDSGKCKYVVFRFFQEWNGSSYSSDLTGELQLEESNIFCGCIKNK